jgi:polygalacturonase
MVAKRILRSRSLAGSSLGVLTWTLAMAGCGGSSQGTDSGSSSHGGATTGPGSGGQSVTSSMSGNASSAPSGGSSSRASGSSAAGSASGSAGGTGSPSGSSGTATSSARSSSASSSGATSSTQGTPPTSGCGAGDANMPPQPVTPPACATLTASLAVAANGVPSESAMDTSRLQSALNACASGQAVRLTTSGSNNAFVTGPITIPSGVSLWVDSGATLYGTRSMTTYGSAGALITVRGANSGIYGEGVIDGQGGEPILGGSGSFWDANGNGGASPALIQVASATNFTMYQITLHNSPMFHVKLAANGFVVWGVTIKTPSKSTNSAGTSLTPTSAHNTDGIDPGEAASNGFIVCSMISDGDDHIAIKGSSPTGVSNLTIAHNHFEAGHGMSIGSEFTGGVSKINVYDLSIDGSNAGTSGGSSNGIRIKSDSSRGGLVNDVTYSDVCTKDLSNPILLTPFYTTATGSDIPQYTNITIQNFHALAGSNTPTVTLDGFDSSHLNTVTLDNVVVDGISSSHVTSEFTTVTLGPGAVNFTPSGSGVTVKNSVSGTSTANACTNKFVTF